MLKSIFSKISPFLIVKEAKAGAKKITPNEQRLVDFCALPTEEVQKRLGTSTGGLSAEKVEEARNEFGPNELKVGDKHGVLMEILLRFKNPLVIQLLIIAIVSLITAQEPSDRASAVIVGFMVFLSVGVAFFQERRSGREIEKLQELVQTNCVIIRDGKELEVPMVEIVPGDLVVLQAGAIIPADLRLITTKDFFIGQSALTGESMPVEKMPRRATSPTKASSNSPTPASKGATSSAALRGRSSSTRATEPISARFPRNWPGRGSSPALIVASRISPG